MTAAFPPVTDGLVTIGVSGGQSGQILVGGAVAGSVALKPVSRDDVVRIHLSMSAPDHHEQAFRALQLLMHHLAVRTSVRVALLDVPQSDAATLAIATAAGFSARTAGHGAVVLSRPVPPLTYTDGVVTIRRQRPDDIDAHLAAIDDEQIDWLWEPGSREQWEALSPEQRRARSVAHLRRCHDSFGDGPKWTFSVDGRHVTYLAYIDCDLDNEHVPTGQANIAYTAHPAYRGQGNVSRAVRLVTAFLRDHTGAQSAHIIVDSQNTASIRVALAAGATKAGAWQNEYGRIMIRHVLPVRDRLEAAPGRTRDRRGEGAG
jgi:RimJ/RimL family protein N-acetyltransferase